MAFRSRHSAPASSPAFRQRPPDPGPSAPAFRLRPPDSGFSAPAFPLPATAPRFFDKLPHADSNARASSDPRPRPSGLPAPVSGYGFPDPTFQPSGSGPGLPAPATRLWPAGPGLPTLAFLPRPSGSRVPTLRADSTARVSSDARPRASGVGPPAPTLRLPPHTAPAFVPRPPGSGFPTLVSRLPPAGLLANYLLPARPAGHLLSPGSDLKAPAIRRWLSGCGPPASACRFRVSAKSRQRWTLGGAPRRYSRSP